MESATANVGEVVDASKDFARRLLTIGENRLELLIVEAQEEREHRIRTLLLAFGVAAFGFFAVLALNIAIVVLFWDHSPAVVLLVVTSLYALAAICLYQLLARQLRDWKSFSATLDQLRKDRECLEKILF